MRLFHSAGCFILAFLFLPDLSIGQTDSKIRDKKRKEVNMSTNENNKTVVRKLYEEVLNKRDMERLSEFISNNFEGPDGAKGSTAFQRPVEAVLQALPDAQWHVQEVIGDGDKVLVRWKLEGTNSGRFQSFRPSGSKISNDGMAIFELKNGKIIKGLVHTDRLGFLQQINVLPENLSRLATSTDHVRFIDKFVVPEQGKQEFLQRVIIARDFLRNLPGFIDDAAYERKDENGNLIFISIAAWENDEAIKNAKEAIQAEYKKQGFDPSEMFERLGITLERGVYKRTY